MHAGQEEDLQVLRAATLRREPKPPAHALLATSHTHTVLWDTRSHTHANATRSTCHSTTDRSKQGKRFSRHSRNEIPSLGRE